MMLATKATGSTAGSAPWKSRLICRCSSGLRAAIMGMWSVTRDIWYCLGLAVVTGCEPRKHASHVCERLLHSRQRIVLVDLVLEIGVAGITHCPELAENVHDRDLSLADDALTLLHFEVA